MDENCMKFTAYFEERERSGEHGPALWQKLMVYTSESSDRHYGAPVPDQSKRKAV